MALAYVIYLLCALIVIANAGAIAGMAIRASRNVGR